MAIIPSKDSSKISISSLTLKGIKPKLRLPFPGISALDLSFGTDHSCNGTIWFKTKIDMYGAFFHQKPSPQRNWEIGDAITLIRGEGWVNSNTFFLWNHLTNELPLVNRLE